MTDAVTEWSHHGRWPLRVWQKLTIWTILGIAAWTILLGFIVGVVIPAWAGLFG